MRSEIAREDLAAGNMLSAMGAPTASPKHTAPSAPQKAPILTKPDASNTGMANSNPNGGKDEAAIRTNQNSGQTSKMAGQTTKTSKRVASESGSDPEYLEISPPKKGKAGKGVR